jgi:hypothetical protein
VLRNRVVCKQRLRSQVHRERGRLRLALFLLEDDVPSGEIMDDFKHGHLHSGKKVKGKKRKVVHNKKQAKAILLSYLRKEGRIGPRKKGKGKNYSKKRVAGK